MKSYLVCEPLLAGNEKQYILDCINTGWISSSGKYIQKFEQEFANYCGTKHAVAVSNGTVALHLALKSIGIKEGDEVIIPNFTMIATAFAICYLGAKPVSVDVDSGTWNIDVSKIEAYITDKTRAIMPVSIFGLPCEMDEINKIAKKYNLIVLEDAAESHGATYKGQKTGSLADLTAFSFFANKNLTTGEGGMILTNNDDYYDKLKYFKNLCFPLNGDRSYIHNDIGYNYRMSNIHAAIGLAQVEKADMYKSLRIKNNSLYRTHLQDCTEIVFQEKNDYSESVSWMNGVILNSSSKLSRDQVITELGQFGIETRKFFVGMNKQPSLIKYGCRFDDKYENTDNLAKNGFYLPSSSSLNEEDIIFITGTLKKILNK